MHGDETKQDPSLQPGTEQNVVRFPQSRVKPTGGASYADLGLGRMAAALGMANEQLTGHWCSNCKGIWFGYLLEVECPQCGGAATADDAHLQTDFAKRNKRKFALRSRVSVLGAALAAQSFESEGGSLT